MLLLVLYINIFSLMILIIFILSYSFNRLFTEMNSSCLIFELIKALKIKTPIIFNMVFDSFLNYWLVINSVIAKNLNPNAELAIPIGTPNNETNAKIGTDPTKIRDYSIKFKKKQTLLCFLLIYSKK